MEYEVDPLFKEMTLKFNDQKNLLLNRIFFDRNLDIILEGKDKTHFELISMPIVHKTLDSLPEFINLELKQNFNNKNIKDITQSSLAPKINFFKERELGLNDKDDKFLKDLIEGLDNINNVSDIGKKFFFK